MRYNTYKRSAAAILIFFMLAFNIAAAKETATGASVTPTTGQAIEATTGQAVQTSTGQGIQTSTGQAIQTSTGQAVLNVVDSAFGIVENGQAVAPGTYYRNAVYSTPNGRFTVNTLEAAVGTRFLKLEASDSGGDIKTARITDQAAKKAGPNRRVVGAINGDFFYTSTKRGLPIGTSIIDGEIRTAVQSCEVFGVSSKGNAFIDNLTLNGNVIFNDSVYPIASVNRPKWSNQIVLYTPAYGKTTATTGLGTEVVVTGLTLPIKANELYKGKISRIVVRGKDTEIPANGVVLSASGLASQFFATAVVGDEVSFYADFSRKDLQYAVSGTPRLVRNLNPGEDIAKGVEPNRRHPRSAIGIKGGKVVMVAVDGRNPGVSDGMTLYEFAELLISLGINNAINLDGGGSTTMLVRRQGDAAARVVNRPSDGSARAVANTIQILSEAPVSAPALIAFKDPSVSIYKGSTYKPEFSVMDKYYNHIGIDQKKAVLSANRALGTIDKQGVFKAASKPAAGVVEATFQSIKGRMSVRVVDQAARVVINTNYINAKPGAKVQLQASAFDSEGRRIIVDPSSFKWSVTNKIGTVNNNGVFTAGKEKKLGSVIAKLGNVECVVDANIGSLPALIESFDLASSVEASAVRGTAEARASVNGEPVKLGASSLRLDYDFTKGGDGTSAAYIRLVEPVVLTGRPEEVGVWVFGNGGRHWVRGVYTNASGVEKTINFTESGGLDWIGWKYVHAVIPSTEQFPISIKNVYIAETSKDRKIQGTLYFDHFAALYGYEEDIYDPKVSTCSITNRQALEISPAEIFFEVSDKGEGINKASIELYVNEEQLAPELLKITDVNKTTIRISYAPQTPLISGSYTLRLRLSDKKGNALNPEYVTSFSIK